MNTAVRSHFKSMEESIHERIDMKVMISYSIPWPVQTLLINKFWFIPVLWKDSHEPTIGMIDLWKHPNQIKSDTEIPTYNYDKTHNRIQSAAVYQRIESELITERTQMLVQICLLQRFRVNIWIDLESTQELFRFDRFIMNWSTCLESWNDSEFTHSWVVLNRFRTNSRIDSCSDSVYTQIHMVESQVQSRL